jgi:N-acetylmuramoyl-L-alanine amidase
VDVGFGNIAEIIQLNAETFNGKTQDDYSCPTNNYLPKGTVDYYKIVTSADGKISYVLLRSGQRIYLTRKIYPPTRTVDVTKQYQGTLPDHNEIRVDALETVDNHSILALDCLWNAPFYLEIGPQKYAAPNAGSNRDFNISSLTVTYVDITFCYATAFTGDIDIPANHPLFKSAELIQNESDYTLRLHLRKRGGFYGWDAYYNEAGQLCFRFLNPAKAKASDNFYGADLTGVKIMLDVGHGGLDGGAVKKDSTGKEWTESTLNMMLSKILQTELESMGATVTLIRTADVNLDTDARVETLVNAAPDLCVAIHQNVYGPDSKVSGFDSMFFTPFSQLAAKKIYEQTEKSEIYAKNHLRWNVYFTCRQSVCPVVLTENGYMTNPADLAGMINEGTLAAKAQAIAQGIADYFLAINK